MRDRHSLLTRCTLHVTLLPKLHAHLTHDQAIFLNIYTWKHDLTARKRRLNWLIHWNVCLMGSMFWQTWGTALYKYREGSRLRKGPGNIVDIMRPDIIRLLMLMRVLGNFLSREKHGYSPWLRVPPANIMTTKGIPVWISSQHPEEVLGTTLVEAAMSSSTSWWSTRISWAK